MGLFPQESEINEHVKELELSDSAASDPKSSLGLVSMGQGGVWRWAAGGGGGGQQRGVQSMAL